MGVCSLGHDLEEVHLLLGLLGLLEVGLVRRGEGLEVRTQRGGGPEGLRTSFDVRGLCRMGDGAQRLAQLAVPRPGVEARAVSVILPSLRFSRKRGNFPAIYWKSEGLGLETVSGNLTLRERKLGPGARSVPGPGGTSEHAWKDHGARSARKPMAW